MDKNNRGLSRRSMLAGTAAGVIAPVVVSASAGSAPAAAAGMTRNITVYADYVPGSTRVGYGLEPGKPTIPGPLLECYEGDTLVIELVNNTDQRLSIHPHGVNYDTKSDGSPFNDSFNKPYETKTYTWKTRTAYQAANGFWMPGSAGYWHYHDHAFGGDHGTVGLMKGLYGGLIVRKRGDLLPSKQFTVVFTEMWINHQVAPNTPIFEANLGERVEFICIGHGNLMHTFHLHAHRWADTRTGMLTSATDNAPIVDNKTLDPGNSFGFQVIAGDGVGPGAWMYHCHVQQHSDDGMSGVFLVRNADGGMPAGAQAAIDRFKGHQHSTTSTPDATGASAHHHQS
ncbi:multicopper oxidase domain-containing protein [Amycolatopsis regifaucium]|uniref:Copper oxidase n=1 Tax=Amycolatopsis regifaucium TaxID=546365 RepID=A0A154MRN8_9PSEU|nr:multicopper oxidase domain-containing protein [Amycolatopsis regifaucium]KZB86942.1 copper oxidase [Amycolatopsis regifaucium]OKA09372.1 copper oxidase [Amycolatopsis regifaucium]SFH59549.1 Multicopper oxidase [Amycolatopsis regifaucium]